MQIDNTSRIGSVPQVDPVSKTPAQATDRVTTSNTADRADVTPVAAQAQGASSQRLEVLRAAVESGTYRVFADDLAHTIVDAHMKP